MIRSRMFRLLLAVLALSFATAVVAQSPVESSPQPAAQSSPQPRNSKTPSPTDYSFRIKAHRIWTDTGLNLNPGDRIHVSGAITVCEELAPTGNARLPLPSAPRGALLVKLDADTPPILASPDADLPILNSSQLYLGINGFHCRGTVPVTVHVDWHKPDQSSH